MSAEEQLTALKQKLEALETKLNQQTASGSTGSESPQQITVKVPRERKLRRFAGGREDGVLEEWISDAKRAIAGHTESDAIDFLFYHLEGAAKEEVHLRPADDRNSPTAIFKVLRDCFGEGLTGTQALQRFFERKQHDRESVREFSHALMVLLARVERLDEGAVTDKDKLLRDQFLENLRDPQLRRDIKRWVRDHPTKTFQQIRDEVQCWMDEDGSSEKRSAKVREVTEEPTCEEARALPNLQSVVKELVASQKLLAENLQKQQQLLAEHISSQQSTLERQQRSISQLMSHSRNTWQPGCFGNLHKLDPFIDKEGLLRVGGRLRSATSPYEIKHPVIVPKKSHVTTLLIRQFHHGKQHHQGYGMTYNAIRQAGYYIINGRSAVSHIVAKCVTCHRLRGHVQDQKMADLPSERTTPAPPFTYTGMDVFSPFYIKERRKELKRWGLIFTCLSSRAIHLETLNSMTSDSFLNALRCFISRRGKVRELRSNQGTNFVGTKNELVAVLKELDTTPLKEYLSSQDCDWIDFNLNAPKASHMGGIWERQIRTARSVLSALLLKHSTQLDDEALRTFMTEAECIVNCRPLTIENLTDPLTPEPLTPNHLLTLKTQVVLPPPGKFESPDQYSRKRWRRVQYLANQLWLCWQKEYCALLQKRQKWTTPKRCMRKGDVVLVCDNESPRNQWPLAVVSKVFPSGDQLVRKVQITTAKDGERRFLERPVHKLVLLLAKEDNEN
ncbi:uncharacterized protein LOC111343532 [Stylophora pistillata]|uniref:uncharacterized protein LOC111343532 n=1 Tax=Stylophora pistillata TaxID=50429 RepID=UPI000C04BBFE|nr:uncharacterized protein LOC111343532 [Stylophora pistillata]